VCVSECISITTIWHIILLLIVHQRSRQICAFVRNKLKLEKEKEKQKQKEMESTRVRSAKGIETPMSIFALNKRSSNLEIYLSLHKCVFSSMWEYLRSSLLLCVFTSHSFIVSEQLQFLILQFIK